MYTHFSVSVLFVFDSEFYDTFNGEDGKSAEEHMIEVISVVKIAYKDPAMKREIGTHINIIADRKTYDGSLYVSVFRIFKFRILVKNK